MDWVETSWDQALGLVAQKWAAVKHEAGRDAFAALCSARCTNEENFLAAKLTRQLMETHNIDHCARL
jgi:predicted molibdopterin-dependent oxidoreductase YjgC